MAEEQDLIFNTKVNTGGATNSVKSLKAELRAVTNELMTLEEGSEAFVEAAKKAGELKDKISDTKDTINAFHPEKKFAALAQVIGIAANGFAAMQGAMALFGAENKELEKTIQKTQGAIALATGLNGLMGMVDEFNNLKLQAKDTFNGIKAAIGSTGIGLLVIALGFIYAYWDDISKAVKNAFPIFNNMGNIFSKLREYAYGAGEVIKNALVMPFRTLGKVLTGDFTGALEEIKKGYNVIDNFQKGAEKGRQANAEIAAKEALEKKIKDNENEIEILKAKGKDTYKLELENSKNKQKLYEDDTTKLAEELQKQKVLIATHEKKISDDKKAADEKKLNDWVENFKKTTAKQKEQEEKKIEEDKKQLDDIAKNIVNGLWKEQEEKDKIAKKNLKTEKDNADKQKELADATAKAKDESYQLTANGLMLLSDIAGKNTDEGKALAIAATTINTYLAAQSAYTSQMAIVTPDAPIRAAIAAGIAVATGLANIKAIMDVKTPSGGGGGGGASVSSPPPPPNIRPVGRNVNITQNGTPLKTINTNQSEQKVYVLESDITNTQNKVSRIENKATIK